MRTYTLILKYQEPLSITQLLLDLKYGKDLADYIQNGVEDRERDDNGIDDGDRDNNSTSNNGGNANNTSY